MKRCSKLLAVCIIGMLIFGACGNSTNVQESSNGVSSETGIEDSVEGFVENKAETSVEADDTDIVEKEKETSQGDMSNLDTNKPMIALTFDDGPNLITTPQVLDLIEEYEITATFFLIGNNIDASSSKVVERAYNMGCEIANHSKSHSNMTTLTSEDIIGEIEYTSNKIEEITGEAPKFFRPPFISVNENMYDNIDLTFICGYGCNDWESSVTAQQRAEMVFEIADDGVIILMHDFQYNSQTVEALKTVIPTLLDEGYQFVTVSQLFEAKGIELSADDKNMYTVVK